MKYKKFWHEEIVTTIQNVPNKEYYGSISGENNYELLENKILENGSFKNKEKYKE